MTKRSDFITLAFYYWNYAIVY